MDIPPVHSTHDRAPIPLWYDPLAHGTQGSTPFSEYVPGAHFTGTKIGSHWILTWLSRLKKGLIWSATKIWQKEKHGDPKIKLY